MFNPIQRIKSIDARLSLAQFNIMLSIWIGLLLNLSFLKTIQAVTPYQSIKAYLLIVATALILISAYYFILQLISWRWSGKAVAIVLVLIGGFSAYFVSELGVLITPDQVQNMVQTDAAEVVDLISFRLLIWTILFVALPIALIIKITIKPESFSRTLVKKLMHLVVSFAVIATLLFVFYVDYAAIFRANRTLKGMISPQNAIASTYSYFKKAAPKKNLALVSYGVDARLIKNSSSASKPKLMVLVVGETARAESFALNGYAKNTNPELSKQSGVINFSQVRSCGTATAVSVPCMFSGMTRKNYDPQLASHREGLLDIAQRAGYAVTWIDNNSGCKGTCDRVNQYEIPESLQQKWCDKGECLDEILVDSLQHYLQTLPANDQTPRLVVLHQMGSHGPAYYRRSPLAFQKFKPSCATNAIQGCSTAALINAYDNSIVYTDHILSQAIKTLSTIDHYRTALWYISDHGESTGEHGMYLHGAPYAIAPSQQTHVPMIMWFSPSWKKLAQAEVSCLTQQRHSKLSQDNLFPSLLSLLDVQTTVINQQQNMLQRCAAV